jgi:hypothetical protein
MLRDVIDRATQHSRPLLLAGASGPASLLLKTGDAASGAAARVPGRSSSGSRRAEIDASSTPC